MRKPNDRTIMKKEHAYCVLEMYELLHHGKEFEKVE